MSDVDMDGALEALSAELPDEVDAPIEADVAPVGDNPSVESFTGFDPTLLPEDMQQVYKSMQADYTRKTQEIAEIRREYEAFSDTGVDVDTALQAIGFLQALDTDPQFAQQVAAQIQQNVGTPNFQEQVNTDTSNNNVGYEGLPPELAQEIEAMREFRAEMAMQQQQQEIIAELEVAENTIKVANPDYTDDDMEAIYSLAYATDGDLMAAQQQYHAIQQRLLGNYLQAKSVPHGATPAPNGPNSVPHRDFSSLDEAHKAAMEAVRNIS